MRKRNEKERLTVYLSPATSERLSNIAASCADAFGRKAGRGNGWNSAAIEAALTLVSDEEIKRLAAQRQAA